MRMTYLSGRERSARDMRLGMMWLAGDPPSGSIKAGNHLCGDMYPALYQREKPSPVNTFQDPQGMLAVGDHLFIAAGGRLYLDGNAACGLTPGEKVMASLGTRAAVFPDKIWCDAATGAWGPMEQTAAFSGLTFGSGSIEGDVSWPFAVGDGVTIGGCESVRANNISAVVRGVDGGRLLFDDNTFLPGSETSEVTVSRPVPSLEAACESGNRLWGCANGTIYGSKLGDMTNFNVFEGLSTDSFAVAAGGGGAFTACAGYGSHILFFMENRIYKLYGSRPSNFQLMSQDAPGVVKGAGGTLKDGGDAIYYLGPDGVYAYAGGTPEKVSVELGAISADRASAGVRRGVYYISMETGSQGRTLSYDIARRVWYPWGEENALAFASPGGKLLMLERSGGLLEPGGGGPEEWSAEFQPFRDIPGQRESLSALRIDAEPEGDGWLSAYVSMGEEYELAASFDERAPSMVIPLRPGRGKAVRLLLRGEGKWIIRSVERVYREGGVRA